MWCADRRCPAPSEFAALTPLPLAGNLKRELASVSVGVTERQIDLARLSRLW